ncbi:MAG: M28-family zinc peptidase [Nitrospirales bacterium]|nr:MAG: M28-family zinc peptidase [Nitrospirales bacterium]
MTTQILPFFLFLGMLMATPALSYSEGIGKNSQIFEAIHTQNMVNDIQTLSGPSYAGRQAGTVGGRQSADFVKKRLSKLGLRPAGERSTDGNARSWTQETPLTAVRIPHTMFFSVFSTRDGKENLRTQLRLGTDFLPILDSPSLNITAPIVFVGYGIDDPARGVNDYEHIDVHNRIVMFLRGKPESYSKWVTHEEKERTARRHGAAGFITLTGPILNRYEARRGMGQTPLAMYSRTSTDERPLPGVWISGQVGDRLFQSRGRSLKDIQAALNEKRNTSSHKMGITAHLQWDSEQEPGTLRNVLGTIPGHDPKLREEIVIVGAHRDHFGKQAGQLFAGADDNASGTAVLLELARIMSQAKPRPARTILFISFDGEERGLLGSKLYVNHPTHLLNNTVAMVNIDHVGVGNGKLTVGLTRLPKAIGEQAATLVNLEKKSNFYGYFPGGDHVPFYEAGIPTVTVVSAGKHPSFHQPSDTPETIQPEILENATRYVLALTWLLVNQ